MNRTEPKNKRFGQGLNALNDSDYDSDHAAEDNSSDSSYNYQGLASASSSSSSSSSSDEGLASASSSSSSSSSSDDDDLNDSDYDPDHAAEDNSSDSRAREHIPIREILNRREIRNLMKELQPARSQSIKPKISYDELKTIVRASGVELEELVSWREETWKVPAPNLAVKKQMENGKWRKAKPGGGRNVLVGALFYRLLKVLSQKCANSTCTNVITGINPEHLNAWHMGHIDASTKTCNPADCRAQTLANAAEEYAKRQLECVECHDQRSNCSWKVNTGIKRKRAYDLRPYRPFTEIINSKEYQDFQNALESSKARFCGKAPKASFDQLKEMTKTHLNFELEDLVTWDETVWNTPNPNNIIRPGNDRQRKVGCLEYAALKKLAGSCAVCLTSIVNVPPDRLSGWHMDHLENKKFDPSDGQCKSPKIAHEEYAKCVLKCSACHKQGPRASWEQ